MEITGLVVLCIGMFFFGAFVGIILMSLCIAVGQNDKMGSTAQASTLDTVDLYSRLSKSEIALLRGLVKHGMVVRKEIYVPFSQVEYVLSFILDSMVRS